MFGLSHVAKRFAGTLLAVSLVALPAMATGATYYVDTAGNDANDGLTPATAWKTITNAAATVPAGLSPGSPNVIMVAAGTYDNTTNGETFPINFANNHVSLTGAGAGTTTIDAEALGDALDVDGWYFSISGFTFSNATDALDISGGGFTVTDNIFDSTVSDGVHLYSSATDLNTSIDVGDMTITGNTFQTTSDGIYLYAYLDFDFLTENLTVTVGDLTISNNSFPVTGGDAIDADGGIEVEDLLNGTVNMGDFIVSDNTFTDASTGADIYYYFDDLEGCQVTVGDFVATNNTFRNGSTGIDFYGDIGYFDNCQVTVGDLIVNNNTFRNQSSYGISVDYWDVEDLAEDTHVTLGVLTISGNEVTSNVGGSDGIYISDIGYFDYIYDTSTVTTGTVSITNNNVYVDDYGLYIYFTDIYDLGEEYFNDTVVVTLGTTNITGNSITSTDGYGAYIEYYDVGYDNYGQSSVILGPLNFTDNTVYSYDYAFYFYVDYWGEYMYEDSSLLINPITISNNILNSSDYTAMYFDMYYIAYETYDNASITVKEFNITNNIISSGDDDGVYIYYEYVGYEMYDSSSLTMSPWTFHNNTVYGGYGDGIYIEYYDYYVASYMDDYSSATLPDWTFTNNSIDCSQDYYGLEFYTYSNPDDNEDYAEANFGSMFIDNNVFNPNKDAGMDRAIYLEIEDFVENGYNACVTTLGDITITNNTIYNINDEAIYLYLDEVGYDFTDRPFLTVGDIDIGNNMIDMADYGIYLYLYLYTNDGAVVTFGDFSIYDNTMTSIYDTGIYFDDYNYNSDPDDATLTIGTPSITNNTISGAPGFDDGIYFYMDNDSDGITIGTPMISGNIISGFDTGIYVELDNQDTATFTCNYLENNDDTGLYFETDATGLVANNNSFVGNGSWGLSVDDGWTAVVDAENNWWGDKLGPAACATCNGVNPGTMGTVDYDPWSLNRTAPFRCGQPFPWILFTPATTAMSPAAQ